MSESNSQEVQCRVCHCGDEQQSRLIFPCKCNGSMKYVHELCLLEWMNTSGHFISKCEICAEKFRYKNVYSVELAKRNLVWEIAAANLKQVQNIGCCLLYVLLPICTHWWFLTSWCMIFGMSNDDVCARSTAPLTSSLLSYFGYGIVNLATVSIWMLLQYLMAHKIFTELCGARETYLVYALRKRLADKAARWAVLEEACIQEERRNFAFADFESMRVEWELEKGYVKEVFAAKTRAGIPLPVNPDEDELVISYNCDIAFCNLALDQLRVAQELGASDLINGFQEHYTVWLKFLKQNKQYFIDHFQKLRVSEQRRRDKLKHEANKRYRRMEANRKKAAELRARAARVATQTAATTVCTEMPTPNRQTRMSEECAAATQVPQTTTGDVVTHEAAVPGPAQCEECDGAAEPIVFKIEKRVPAPMHPMMVFNTIMMAYGIVILVGIALMAVPAAVGRSILFIHVLNQPLTTHLQHLSITVALYCQHLVYGVLTMLEYPSPQVTVPPATFQQVARFVCIKLRTVVEYMLGYAVYFALMCLCCAVHVMNLHALNRLDGPLSEMIPQYFKYFLFQRSPAGAKVSLTVLLYLVAAPVALVLLLAQLDHYRSSGIHTTSQESVEVAYKAITTCIFAAMASCLLVYSQQVCEDFQRELGPRFQYNSPWSSLATIPSANYYLQLLKSFAMVSVVALLLLSALIVLPLSAARSIVPAVRHLSHTADPGGRIVQWLFLLVFTRCVVRKLLITRSAAWFAHWIRHYFLVPTRDVTAARSPGDATAAKQPSWSLQALAWMYSVTQQAHKSDILSVFIAIVLGMALLAALCVLLLVHPLVAATYFMRHLDAHTDRALPDHSMRVFVYYPAGCIVTWIFAYTARFLVQDITCSALSVVNVCRVMRRAGWMAVKLLSVVLLWVGVPPLLVGTLLHELVMMPPGYGLRNTIVPPSVGMLLNATLWRHGFLIITTIMMGVGIAHDTILCMVTEKISNVLTYKHMVSLHVPVLLKLVEFAVVPALFTLLTPVIRPQFVWVMCYIYPAYVAVVVFVFVQDCVRAYMATMYRDLMDDKYLVGRQLMNCDERSAF